MLMTVAKGKQQNSKCCQCGYNFEMIRQMSKVDENFCPSQQRTMWSTHGCSFMCQSTITQTTRVSSKTFKN